MRNGGVQIVDVPGVGEVEFPDSMSDGEIAGTIKANLPKWQATPSEAEMMADLQTADAAGDTELAQHIAARIKAARVPQMAGFDPDAYLKATAPAGFDPDAYLAATALPPARPGVAESGVRGALQGASFGFGDEAAAAVDAALPGLLRNDVSRQAVGKGQTYAERYRNARDYYRGRNEAAESANPGTYLGGQFAGAVAAPGGAAGGLGRAVGQGALAGVGYSDADVTRGDAGNLASDAAIGGAFGAGAHGAGKLLRGGLSRLAARGAQREAVAAARAGTQAAEEVAEGIRSAAGKLGGEVQKGSRQVENLMRLEPAMTPSQAAQLATQAQTVKQLQQQVAQSTLDALPAQAGTIAGRHAELAALQTAAPQAVAERTTKLLTPQVREDARTLFKSYGEPAVAAFLGYKAADLAGADPETKAGAAAVAGLLGGRTRAGKALRTRLVRPAHQAAIGRAEQKIAQSGVAEALVKALRRGVPAMATDAATDEE